MPTSTALALAACWKFKYNLQCLLSCGFILGTAEGKGNLGSQGSGVDVLARQPPVEKIRAVAVVESHAVAVYSPRPLGLADRALLVLNNRVAPILAISLDTRRVDL